MRRAARTGKKAIVRFREIEEVEADSVTKRIAFLVRLPIDNLSVRQ
jgi:hypothetical protein